MGLLRILAAPVVSRSSLETVSYQMITRSSNNLRFLKKGKHPRSHKASNSCKQIAKEGVETKSCLVITLTRHRISNPNLKAQASGCYQLEPENRALNPKS
jgi:glycogen debranching enzyme